MDNKTAEKALEKLLRANESEYTSVRHFVEHWLGGEGKVREMIEVAESHKDRLVFLRFGIANIRQALHRENRRGAINDTLWVLQNVSPNLTLFDYMDFLLDETEHAALSAPRVPAGWRPIETAPMDGTAVLVMRDIWPGTKSGRAEECNGHNTYVAEWWSEEGHGGEWVCYMDAVLDQVCPIVPTHWMPLPHPPSMLAASPEPVADSQKVIADLRAEVEALREVIGDLISAATLGANWMRFWVDHSECDCEDGHHCGVNKRMEEIEKIEQAIKKAGAARLREGGE